MLSQVHTLLVPALGPVLAPDPAPVLDAVAIQCRHLSDLSASLSDPQELYNAHHPLLVLQAAVGCTSAVAG